MTFEDTTQKSGVFTATFNGLSHEAAVITKTVIVVAHRRIEADAVDTIFNAPSTLGLRYQTASVLIIGVNAAGDVQLLDGCAIDVAEWGTIIIIKGFLFSATIEGEGLLFGTRKGACKRVVACAHHNRVACVLFHRNGDVFSEADILATIGVALFDGIGKCLPVFG